MSSSTTSDGGAAFTGPESATTSSTRLVHSFHVTKNPIGENALYTYSIEIDGPWQLRLFDQLVRDGRAQRIELD